jgi:hypothetical protein
MKYIKNKKQFPKVGFKVLLWIGLLYSSLGQALAQVPETAAKSSEIGAKPSEIDAKPSEADARPSEADGKPSETDAKPSETAKSAELEQEKIEVTKPVPGSLQDFDILYTNNIFDPNRKPDRPGRKRPDPKPEPKIDAFTLIGLMAYTAPKSSETAPKSSETAPKSSETAPKSSETAPKSSETAPKSSEVDRQIAVLSGSSSEYNGVFKLNDQIDNLKLISLSDKAVSFAEGEATFSVNIGTGLRRVDGGAWKESSERVRTASRSGSSRSQYSSRGTARSDDNKDSTKDSEDKGDESDGSEDSPAELLRKMMERRRQEVGE